MAIWRSIVGSLSRIKSQLPLWPISAQKATQQSVIRVPRKPNSKVAPAPHQHGVTVPSTARHPRQASDTAGHETGIPLRADRTWVDLLKAIATARSSLPIDLVRRLQGPHHYQPWRDHRRRRSACRAEIVRRGRPGAVSVLEFFGARIRRILKCSVWTTSVDTRKFRHHVGRISY
jgi:hypothetical protein